MTKEFLLSDLEETTRALMETVSHFTHQAFNQKPSETAWSAAQIADHLLKVGFSTYKAVSGETVPTNRPPEQKIAIIKQAMEDEATKRVAPEWVLPAMNEQQTGSLVEQLKKQEDLLKKSIQSSDITNACMSFKHPYLGTLTKMEWLYFHIYHVQRHLRQLKRLERKAV